MKNNKKIFALGFFDGVHRGHQVLMKECIRLAKENNCGTAAITFDRHPSSIYNPDPPKLISTNADREILLRSYGMEEVYLLPVNEHFMSTHWRHFLEYMIRRGAVGFVCGDDFHFGYKGIGNTDRLQKFCQERGLACFIVQEQAIDGLRISSTHIRKLISEGRMDDASEFLGHPHLLSGIVVPGRKLGRTIGVPTANFLIPSGVIVPKWGVYSCLCTLQGKTYAAVTNIGNRPTVGGHQLRAETWIMGFEGDLYGQTITLEVYEYLRPEQKFESLEDLKVQILKDAGRARRLLQSRY